MKIDKNMVVTVTYDLMAGNPNEPKEHIESADEKNPFVYLHGHSGLIEKFENELSGLAAGDTFNFEVESAIAYGGRDEEAIVELPIDTFKQADGKVDQSMLQVGTTVPMMDNEGHHMNGTITKILKDAVEMDFNHPLAGKDLHFIGKVVEMRAASDEEISHGHVHTPGMHQH